MIVSMDADVDRRTALVSGTLALLGLALAAVTLALVLV